VILPLPSPGNKSNVCSAQGTPLLCGLTRLRSLNYMCPVSMTRRNVTRPDAGVRWAIEEEEFAMSRRCDLTGKTAQVGHKVSHSNRKTKRRFLPNLLNVSIISDTLGRAVRLRVSANALKTVDHRGGLDAFLLKAKEDELSPKALELKRQIDKKRVAAAA